MDESTLQNRLETIERRQSFSVVLLLGLYLFGGLWLLVREVTAVTIWNASAGVVVLGLVASFVGIYRRRQAR